MIRVRTEKEYLVKVVNYKGNILKIEKPRDRGGFYKLAVQVCRIYERAKEGGFLTRELLEALRKLADLILHRSDVLHLLIANPSLIRALKRITVEKIDEDIVEEIIEGKIREHDRKKCHVCGCALVYPAYVARKRGDKIEKISKAIGIKCLNSLKHKIEDIVSEIKVIHNEIESFVQKNKETFNKSKFDTRPIIRDPLIVLGNKKQEEEDTKPSENYKEIKTLVPTFPKQVKKGEQLRLFT